MNSQTPSPDDEHPTEPLPGAGSQRPTEPLPASDAVPPGPASSTSERLSGGAQGGPTAPPAADPAQGYAFHASPTPPPPSNDFFGWIRSQGISRGTDRWIGGVCSGIAHRLGVDPIIIRGALVVLTLLAGIGVLLYGLAWALLPEPDGRIHVQEAGAGRWSSGMTGALIATVLGLTGLGGGFWGWSHNGLSGLLWTVFWVAGAIFLIYHLSQRNKARPTMAGYAPAAPGMPYTTGRPGTEHTSSFSAATTSGPTQGFPPAPPYSGGTAGGLPGRARGRGRPEVPAAPACPVAGVPAGPAIRRRGYRRGRPSPDRPAPVPPPSP